MIKNCAHKGLEELYVNGDTSRIGKSFHKNILLIMDHLAGIADLKDCHGVKDFHPLKGALKGRFSMHVNGNYCIVFKLVDGHVCDVDFVDYHGK